MEDASHGGLDGSVVEIDRFWVVAVRASGGVAEPQRAKGLMALSRRTRSAVIGPETGRQRLVAASVADSADDALPRSFFRS